MKKTLFVGFTTLVMFVVSAVSFAGSTKTGTEARGDHEGKPCHAYFSNGSRCHCRSCYGNNWGNYYCIRCKHPVKAHY